MSNTGNISSSEHVTGAISGRRELNGRLSQGSSRVAGLVTAGSSGAGTSDYERLRNKPQIESVELIGNRYVVREGAAYTEAYDPEEFGRVYEEGEIIESEATDEDYAEAGKILMGKEE